MFDWLTTETVYFPSGEIVNPEIFLKFIRVSVSSFFAKTRVEKTKRIIKNLIIKNPFFGKIKIVI